MFQSAMAAVQQWRGGAGRGTGNSKWTPPPAPARPAGYGPATPEPVPERRKKGRKKVYSDAKGVRGVDSRAGGGAGVPVHEDREDEKEEAELMAGIHDSEDGGLEPRPAYVEYRPRKLRMAKGLLQKHPGNIVESIGLAAVDPPDITYKLQLPRQLLRSGDISDLQAEAVVYACQQHEQRLPSGERAAMALGDSTGVGKGRILAALIWENILKGNPRSVWVTASPFLGTQIKRDLKDINLEIPIYELNNFRLSDDLSIRGGGKGSQGLMIATYRTLLTEKATGSGGRRSRLDQLLSWVGGEEFDGVLALDEAHKAKNLAGDEDGKGKGSKTAAMIKSLQDQLPNARVVYCSATLATGTTHLQYLVRLGLWGPGTGFPGPEEFSSGMQKAGLAALELLATDLKRRGRYLARTLGFSDAEFALSLAPLSPGFEEMYDKCALLWMDLLLELQALIPPAKSIKPKDDEEKKSVIFWPIFWGYHQRFFKSLFVAAKVPHVVGEARKALEAGHQVVIGLQGTGEAQVVAQLKRRNISQVNKDDDAAEPGAVNMLADEELSQAREIVEGLLREHIRGELFVNVEGADPDELADDIRQRYRRRLAKIDNLPRNPLDELIDSLGGPDHVAELTGRSLRLVDGKYFKTAVSQTVHETERAKFQNGDKRVAIISEAASTGISLHASRIVKTSHMRRVHFVLELAWSADRSLQQLGRTHRTNQTSGPLYRLVVSNKKLGGDVRFACSVARRLCSLGAITQANMDASAQTLDLKEYNIESKYGQNALNQLFPCIQREGDYELETIMRNVILSADGNPGSVPRFFNRVLGISLAQQERLVDKYFRLFDEVVRQAKLDGKYESGIVDIRAEQVGIEPPVTAFKVRDPTSGVEHEVRAIKLRLNRGLKWESALLELQKHKDTNVHNGFYRSRAGARDVFLAILREGCWFKVLRPDMGRSSRVDKTLEDLRRDAVKLDRTTAKDPWIRRYNDAEELCTHGEPFNRCCTMGRRITYTWMVVGDLIPLWTRLKNMLGRKRLRVVRAETTDGAKRRLVGVLSTRRSAERALSSHLGPGEIIELQDEVEVEAEEEDDGGDDDQKDAIVPVRVPEYVPGKRGGGGGGGAAARKTNGKAKAPAKVKAPLLLDDSDTESDDGVYDITKPGSRRGLYADDYGDTDDEDLLLSSTAGGGTDPALDIQDDDRKPAAVNIPLLPAKPAEPYDLTVSDGEGEEGVDLGADFSGPPDDSQWGGKREGAGVKHALPLPVAADHDADNGVIEILDDSDDEDDGGGERKGDGDVAMSEGAAAAAATPVGVKSERGAAGASPAVTYSSSPLKRSRSESPSDDQSTATEPPPDDEDVAFEHDERGDAAVSTPLLKKPKAEMSDTESEPSSDAKASSTAPPAGRGDAAAAIAGPSTSTPGSSMPDSYWELMDLLDDLLQSGALDREQVRVLRRRATEGDMDVLRAFDAAMRMGDADDDTKAAVFLSRLPTMTASASTSRPLP